MVLLFFILFQAGGVRGATPTGLRSPVSRKTTHPNGSFFNHRCPWSLFIVSFFCRAPCRLQSPPRVRSKSRVRSGLAGENFKDPNHVGRPI